jgi:hypothetical protein
VDVQSNENLGNLFRAIEFIYHIRALISIVTKTTEQILTCSAMAQAVRGLAKDYFHNVIDVKVSVRSNI